MTLKDLFKKYKDLDNPKISGVEFYKFISDKDELDLKVISSLDEDPGELSVSGFEMGDEDRKVGNYLLAFPFHARTMVFKTVDDIDKHLQTNNGKFRLPGYVYDLKKIERD